MDLLNLGKKIMESDTPESFVDVINLEVQRLLNIESADAVNPNLDIAGDYIIKAFLNCKSEKNQDNLTLRDLDHLFPTVGEVITVGQLSKKEAAIILLRMKLLILVILRKEYLASIKSN